MPLGEPYLGEIRLFAFAFGATAPGGWQVCDGSLIDIDKHQALFSILGTQFGGDGKQTFAIPDFQGRAPMGAGARPEGGEHYTIGEARGTETVALSEAQIPAHSHRISASTRNGDSASPGGRVLAAAPVYAAPDALKPLRRETLAKAGGGGHENMQPSLCLRYCIATAGVYPYPLPE